jgi:DNA-directed RNA polymerase I subunit RPA1
VETPKLLMVNLVRDAVKRSVIQQVPGLGDCTFVADEKAEDGSKIPVIHTSGVNLRAIWEFPEFVDVDRIITNDIATTLEEYGVEACRNNIIRELRGVFQSHNIAVDNRHLNLIADYMTRNGEFTPFNRLGLAGNISPFTKMSFETTVAFLRDALIEGDWDNLTTPSGRIVVGKLGKVGTGSFDVLGMAPTCHGGVAS